MVAKQKKLVIASFLVAVLAIVGVLGFSGDTAFADTPDQDAYNDTCSIEKLGWILCPIMTTAGKVGDRAFEMLANNFLYFEPELANTGGGTYMAWTLTRNIANIAFIGVFLIVILSQVTGRGVNNYGIKKLLPRLIIGAILVNISFFICQGMVDLSNIIGFELKHFLVQISYSISLFQVFPSSVALNSTTTNGSLGIMSVVIVGGIGALVWMLLPGLGIAIAAVIITCLTVVVILLMRKALIVLLIVASPLAFVAYLLPNTERMFQKWLRMFWQLLMVFPVVAALFGGGQLASAIILTAGMNNLASVNPFSSYHDNSGKCVQLPYTMQSQANDLINFNNDPNSTINITPTDAQPADCGSPTATPLMLGLTAAGVAVAPLLAVWSVLKGALNAAGAIGGKLSGMVEKTAAGGVKGIGDKYKNSTIGQMRERTRKNDAIAMRGGYYDGMNPIKRGRSRLNRALNNAPYKDYRDQRKRMADKDESEYIRGKAQDAIAQGTYDDLHKEAMDVLKNPKATNDQVRDAEQKLKIARMAIGAQEGHYGMQMSNAQLGAIATENAKRMSKGMQTIIDKQSGQVQTLNTVPTPITPPTGIPAGAAGTSSGQVQEPSAPQTTANNFQQHNASGQAQAHQAEHHDFSDVGDAALFEAAKSDNKAMAEQAQQEINRRIGKK